MDTTPKQPDTDAVRRAHQEGFITHLTTMGKSADEVKERLDTYKPKLDKRLARYDGLRTAVRGSIKG